VQRFRDGLVIKAHRLCVSLDSRRESNEEEEGTSQKLGGVEADDPIRTPPPHGSSQVDSQVPASTTVGIVLYCFWVAYEAFCLIGYPQKHVNKSQTYARCHGEEV